MTIAGFNNSFNSPYSCNGGNGTDGMTIEEVDATSGYYTITDVNKVYYINGAESPITATYVTIPDPDAVDDDSRIRVYNYSGDSSLTIKTTTEQDINGESSFYMKHVVPFGTTFQNKSGKWYIVQDERASVIRQYVFPRHYTTRLIDYNSSAEEKMMKATDEVVELDSSSGSFTVLIPSASFIEHCDQKWLVRKISSDYNRVILKLMNPDDSAYGEYFYATKLEVPSTTVDYMLGSNDKYSMTVSSAGDTALIPEISTLTPEMSGSYLITRGNLNSLGPEDSVNINFRYRDVESGSGDEPWNYTTEVATSVTGTYDATILVVSSSNIHAVQARVENQFGQEWYGSQLETSSPYYSNQTIAYSDGLRGYWPFQETGTASTSSVDVMSSYDLTLYNEPYTYTSGTVGSGSEIIYERYFGANPQQYCENQDLQIPFSTNSITILLQIQMDSVTGDHTILSHGTNILSLASDMTSIQLELNGNLTSWTTATPFGVIKNMFIIANRTLNLTYLYDVTGSTANTRIIRSGVPNSDGASFRIARGYPGDSNHQDYEYADDMYIRSVAWWNRVLTDAEMIDIVTKLDVDGEYIVE